MEVAEELKAATVECGAFKAAFVMADQIVLNTQFRDICKSNSCGRYNRCYQCPPDVGEIEELMDRVRSFPFAVLYQSVTQIEDSFDFEGMMDAAREHAMLSQRIQERIQDIIQIEYLHLSSGCRLCDRCAKVDGLPCRYPGKALGAMEGYGIDVYNTVKGTPLLYVNGTNTVTYFGMILLGN